MAFGSYSPFKRPKLPRPPRARVPRPDPAPPRAPRPPQPPRVGTLTPVGGPTFGAAPPPPPPPRPPAAPQPAPAAPPTPPLTAQAPPPPNYAAMIDADPRYIEAASALAARLNNAYVTFGWVPDPTSPTGYRLASGQDYAGSRVQQLQREAAQSSRDVQNAMNARGFLLSGAQVQGQRNVQDAHAAQLAQAFAEFLGLVADVESDRADVRREIENELRAQPAPEPPPPATTAPGTPQQQIDRRANNNAALDALFRTNGVTGLAQLWHAWRGKVDDHVLAQIDAKLRDARARAAARPPLRETSSARARKGGK
jgi:hypothetical protein